MPTVRLPSGETIPALGQGTWHMAERRSPRRDEIAALRTGLDLGMTLIDTAEMYGDGGAEELVGEAIAGRRDEVFLVSKVLPTNASRRGTIAACERSLRRLRTDRLDLYLLHWRGAHPARRRRSRRSRSWRRRARSGTGASATSTSATWRSWSRLPGGDAVATNQVLYNLARRGIEYDLLPWCRRRAACPIMAYSPIEQGRPVQHPVAARGSPRGTARRRRRWRWRGCCATTASARSRRPAARPTCARTAPRSTSSSPRARPRRLDVAFPPPGGPEPLEVL